jgi:hypothetical protein
MPVLSRPIVVIGALAASTFLVGSTLAVAAASGHTIKACAAKSDGALRVVDSTNDCTRKERGLSWNTRGPRGPVGPSGVVAMASANIAQNSATNTSSTPKLVGTGATITLTPTTAALVTGTLDFHSTNGGQMYSTLGVCYQHGTSDPAVVTSVLPDFTAASDSYFAQTVTGVVKGLPAGSYKVGLCTKGESSNAGHGYGAFSVMIGQTG